MLNGRICFTIYKASSLFPDCVSSTSLSYLLLKLAKVRSICIDSASAIDTMEGAIVLSYELFLRNQESILACAAAVFLHSKLKCQLSCPLVLQW